MGYEGGNPWLVYIRCPADRALLPGRLSIPPSPIDQRAGGQRHETEWMADHRLLGHDDLGPESFVIGGYLFLRRDAQVLAANAHLGCRLYLLFILGLWKVLGAVAVVIPGFPRLKEWAYAGFFFDLTGAAASHAFAGDGAADILAPLGFLGPGCGFSSGRSVQPAAGSVPSDSSSRTLRGFRALP